ncbi:hypothetical protein ACJX0J_033231, partial [Zea mays]
MRFSFVSFYSRTNIHNINSEIYEESGFHLFIYYFASTSYNIFIDFCLVAGGGQACFVSFYAFISYNIFIDFCLLSMLYLHTHATFIVLIDHGPCDMMIIIHLDDEIWLIVWLMAYLSTFDGYDGQDIHVDIMGSWDFLARPKVTPL